jgi:DNA invertase Pin-like site-specific DNA recombinase
MLTELQRQTILELHQKGMGIRQISRTLGHSRHTVRKVRPPDLTRACWRNPKVPKPA